MDKSFVFTISLFQPVHQTATYRCDDTRGCVMPFWPHDDEYMCSKHVEAWNKLVVRQNLCASSWLITEIKLYMFRKVPLSIIRGFSTVNSAMVYVIQVCWQLSTNLYVLLCVRWKTPDDGQRNCPKHVEFYSKNKFEKLVHLVGFIIRIYHDARSSKRQKQTSSRMSAYRDIKHWHSSVGHVFVLRQNKEQGVLKKWRITIKRCRGFEAVTAGNITEGGSVYFVGCNSTSKVL